MLGCGYGHDARLLARAGCDVTGIDVADYAISKARQGVRDGLSLRYEVADLFQSQLDQKYTMAWEHTCFCAIEPGMRAKYVEAVWGMLEQNGCLLGVFFTNPDVEPDEGPPFGASRSEICALFATHFVLEWESEPERFFEGREGREHVMLFRRLSDCTELVCG